MNKEYKLIELNKRIDKITNKKIFVVELAEIEKNTILDGFCGYTGHHSDDNDLFIYEESLEIEDFFLNDPEGIKTINLDDFNELLIDEGGDLKRVYIKNDLSRRIIFFDFWSRDASEHLQDNETIGFTFTHVELSSFRRGENYDIDKTDLKPIDPQEINKRESVLFVGNGKVFFGFQNETNSFNTVIEGDITEITFFDLTGKIKKIKTLSNYALNENVIIEYTFEDKPLKPLNRSVRNLIISVYLHNWYDDKTLLPPLSCQWSLLFGKYLGPIKFK